MKSHIPQQAGEGFDSIQFERLPHIEGYAGRTLAITSVITPYRKLWMPPVETLIDLQAQGKFCGDLSQYD